MPNLLTEFQARINGNGGEPVVQDFLERHPFIIPNTEYVFANTVISKPPLGADHYPDFAYINPQSGPIFLRLVEIESPKKKIFKKNDEFSQRFHSALQQVHDWLIWCHQNAEFLRNFFQPLYEVQSQSFPLLIARGLLIYGRRSEINTTRRKERWAQMKLTNQFIKIQTYDGFSEERQGILTSGITLSTRCAAYRKRSFELKHN